MSTSALASRTALARRRAFALFGVLLVAANLRAPLTSVGPVVNDVRDDLRLSAFSVSALTSVPLLAFALVSPVAPSVAKRLGLERTLAGAVLLLAIGTVIRSLQPGWLLWWGTAMVGAAIAVLNVALPSLVKRDFPTRIGPITGAYSAVQSCLAAGAAGLAAPIATHTEAGWRLAIGVWAVLAAVAFLGFVPLLLRPGLAAEPPAPRPERDRRASPWRSAIGWQVTIAMGLQSMFFYVLLAWLSPIEQAAGASPVEAGLHQSFLNFGSLAGSLVCSWLLHRLRDQRPIAISGGALMLASILGLVGAPQLGWIWSWAAGLASGVNLVLALSLFGLRTRDHHSAAALSGMAQCLGYAVAALGPPRSACCMT
ncbi:MFS transporter [Actinomadura sp. J1-007]|uniref:CynX/NimT family MFS transporter n=1 Tax=Actinomadura sp. J1-007 TaxID=2661913 RepID=UPI0019D587AC|nr:MFS transporter [Actinomadura sp. J1-007]